MHPEAAKGFRGAAVLLETCRLHGASIIHLHRRRQVGPKLRSTRTDRRDARSRAAATTDRHMGICELTSEGFAPPTLPRASVARAARSNRGSEILEPDWSRQPFALNPELLVRATRGLLAGTPDGPRWFLGRSATAGVRAGALTFRARPATIRRASPCDPAAGACGTAGNRADLPCATSFPRFPAVGSARRRRLSHRPVWRTGGRPARRRMRRRVARPARLTRTPAVVRDQDHGFPAACE